MVFVAIAAEAMPEGDRRGASPPGERIRSGGLQKDREGRYLLGRPRENKPWRRDENSADSPTGR